MKQEKNNKIFPSDFLWGASTAGHQVDGGLEDQWTQWEKRSSRKSAQSAYKRLGKFPSWEGIKAEAQDQDNYISGRGVDHHGRYKEDFDLAKELQLNAFRFSIEWSKIEPKEGEWDESAITHYRTYIAELQKRNIEPFPNLWHWTHPVWFEEKGGFTKRRNIKYFERFVQKVSEELLEGVAHVVTINEANNFVSLGYVTGIWPPQKRNPILGAGVMYNLVIAQRRSYKILKESRPSLTVGVAHNVAANLPLNPRNPIHKVIARFSNYFWDTWFYRRIRNYQDYIGVNFYMTNYWTGLKFKNPQTPLNDLGWYMEPARLYDVIMRLSKKFDKPIIITENGVADSKDQYRQWWIEETMGAMQLAINDGADLRGYFHWSLLDNFEWAEGYWPKFGLIEVDRGHGMKRRIRPSAKWYAQTLKNLQKS